MKYVIGSVVIVAFAAGAYAALRVLAFKEMLDAFAKDIRGTDADGAAGDAADAKAAANGRDTHAS